MGSYKTYQEFQRAAPLSKERFNPTPENVRRWEQVTRNHQRNSQFKENNRHDNRADLKVYKELKEKRAVYRWADFPQHIKEKLNVILHHILTQWPEVEEIYLTGSYVTGSYIDETAPDELIEAKKKIKRCKPSDFDIITYPEIRGLDEVNGLKIDFLKDRGDVREAKVKIWPIK